MLKKIKVMVVDPSEAMRDNILKLLEFQNNVLIVGQMADGEEAIRKSHELKPDVVIMDMNMTGEGVDGIRATANLITELPETGVILMGMQMDREYLRRALAAGACEYLVKPFTGDELVNAVHKACQKRQVFGGKETTGIKMAEDNEKQGKIITVFSSKGGVGKTTIATNLAVALAEEGEGKIGVLDADLQFGDVALFLNLLPRVTIADLMGEDEEVSAEALNSCLIPYSGQIDVLSSPLRPEQAEMINGSEIAKVLRAMRRQYKYTVVDTTPIFNDTMLSVLEMSDIILVVSSLDLPTIKNIKLCLEIMESLGYDDEKVRLVLNRANTETGMGIREVEESLGYCFAATIPSDGKTVVASVNKGIPFVASHPETNVAQSIFRLAKVVVGGGEPRDADEDAHEVRRLH